MIRALSRALETRRILGALMLVFAWLALSGQSNNAKFLYSLIGLSPDVFGWLLFAGGVGGILFAFSSLFGLFMVPLFLYCIASIVNALSGTNLAIAPAFITLGLYLIGMSEIFSTHKIVIVPVPITPRPDPQWRTKMNEILKNLLGSRKFTTYVLTLAFILVPIIITALVPAAWLPAALAIASSLIIAVAAILGFTMQDIAEARSRGTMGNINGVTVEALQEIIKALLASNTATGAELVKQLGASVPAPAVTAPEVVNAKG